MDLNATAGPTTGPTTGTNPAPPEAVGILSDEAQSPVTGETRQFATFTVGEEVYAVDIMAVREIKGWTEVARLPNQPDHMRGVLNLRGVIVPIFDLRCRFGQGLTEATAIHVVVIVAVAARTVGILVDSVSDILTVGVAEIRPVPELDSRGDHGFLKGLAASGERMVALLNLEELFDLNDVPHGTAGVSTTAVVDVAADEGSES